MGRGTLGSSRGIVAATSTTAAATSTTAAATSSTAAFIKSMIQNNVSLQDRVKAVAALPKGSTVKRLVPSAFGDEAVRVYTKQSGDDWRVVTIIDQAGTDVNHMTSQQMMLDISDAQAIGPYSWKHLT